MIIRIYDKFEPNYTLACYGNVDYVDTNEIVFLDGDTLPFDREWTDWEEIEHTFTVALMTDYGWTETCHPLAIGVDRATAKSIRRHYEKGCHYDDYNGTGTYIAVVSRIYCINHADFETETTLENEEV